MKQSLKYNDNELSDIYAQLTSHGRLFLNSVLRACNASDISEAKEKLEPLSEALSIIETISPSVAHFIWVGPPTSNKSELLGIRSLKNLKHDQKINFWVLEEHVLQYEAEMANLNLSNIEVVSIEGYAEKINFESNNITLTSQIEKFKILAHQKLAEAQNESNANEKKLKIADAIRDRVTIVDHIKPLIPLFEGGWVFDVDLIFPFPEDNVKTKVLPDLQKWTFPLIGTTIDVWFFYCQKVLNWDGSNETYLENDASPYENMFNARNAHLKKYIELANAAYEERGENPLSLDFIGKLGDAICQIGGASLTFRQMLNNEDNGRPINENVGVQSCRQSYGDLQYQLVGPNRMSSLKLPCEINIIKYYGRSYLPQNTTSQTKECSLNESLLYIADKNKFREVLTQRCQFTDFDITAKFNVTTENIGCLNKHRFELIGLTMFHTALIFRQDLFFSLLTELPVEKMANLLSVKAEIPAGMFPFERNGINSESMEPHTLLSLAERLNGVCQKFKKEDISLGEFLKEAARKIMDVKIVARLFKEMQEPCRSSWAAKKDLDVIIQCIIDNSNQGSAGNAFFSLNHNAAVRDILIFFGVNEFTCDAIRKTMDDKIIQEETAAEVLLRSR